MREAQAQMILLVRAFEEVDREGRILSLEQRVAATRRAVMVTTREDAEGVFARSGATRNEETVTRRARLLFNALGRRLPSLYRVMEIARLRSSMGPAVFAIALAIGMGTNALGPARQVNLLSVPFFGLLAWNLAMYLLLLVAALFGRSIRARLQQRRGADADVDAATGHDGLVTGLAGWVVRFALWRSRRGWKKVTFGDPEQARILARAFTRCCGLWHRLTGPLLESRVRRRLHLAAAGLMVGVVSGMYVRGLAFEYRATWESTLLGATQVQWLLDTVLGPAATVLRTRVPDVAPLRAPGDGPAAMWIHLFALTALLFAIGPRIVLALFEAWRSARLKADLPIDFEDGYYRRIFAEWRGARRRVEVLPYSYRPQATTVQHLKMLFYDFFGAQSDMQVLAPVTYGDDPPPPGRESEDGSAGYDRYLVVLFNAAQSPETEVHGAFLEKLKHRLGPGDKLLVLTDTGPYRRQVAAAGRSEERQQAWNALGRTVGLEPVHIDPNRAMLDPDMANERMNALRAAVWTHGPDAEAV